jgi:hypothetical protein
MTDDRKTRELEWFDLETRMRELLYHQLEPVILKAKEDREQHNTLKIHCKQLEKRLKDLEIVVLGDKNGETAILNIMTRCAEIDGTVKKEVVRIDQELSQVSEHLKKIDFSLNTTQESVKIVMDKESHSDADITQLKLLIDDHKIKVLSEVEKLNSCFQEMNKAYIEVAIKTDEKSLEAYNKAQINSIEMGTYKREIDAIRKDIFESLTLIKEVRSYKLDSSIYEKRNEVIDKKFTDIVFELQRNRDDILNRDSFIDKFIPLQTVTLISDYLHYMSDLKTRKKIAEYENLKLKELNNLVLDNKDVDSRDNRITQILDDMKHIEERKVELLTTEPLSGKITVQKIGEIVFPPNFDEKPKGPLGLSKEEVEEIVQKILSIRLEADFLKFRLEFQSTFKDINKLLASYSTQFSTMDQQILSELQEISGQFNKKINSIEVDNSNIIKSFETLKSEYKFSVHSLKNLGQMVACLVENAQIQQALEAQDEEDRHNMAYNFEKEMQNEMVSSTPKNSSVYKSTIPSANFSFQKKCISCGNASSILSGFRTSLLYRPTPLFYRNKKFERPELINLKGKMIKNCWETTVSTFPWKNSLFEKILNEAAKGSASTSIEDNEKELPLLATPKSRAITHNRKFRYGSLHS